MKHSTILALFTLATISTQADVLRLSEPVQSDESSETFGEVVQDMPSLMSLADILSEPDKYVSESFTMEAKVKKVCQKKGCFFIAQQGQETIRIAFKDYGFFVPTNITDRTVTLVGKLVQQEVTAKQAEHFSKDLGEESSVKSGVTYGIIASSVKVPKS